MITIEPPSRCPADVLTLSKAGLARFVNRARAAVGIDGEVHVLLADDRTLRRLNRQFRGEDKATDVLSFPAAESGAGVAGDLAISLETAARQAKQYGHSLRDEARVLLLHGVLHLAGFDHETDQGEMAAREAELRRELGLKAGLIGRTGVDGEKTVGRKVRAAVVMRSTWRSFGSGSRKNARTFAQDDGRKTEADSSAALRNDKTERGRR